MSTDQPAAAVNPAAAAGGQFYDSTRPWLIRAGTDAALYFDGLYGTAGRANAGRFDRVRWITITGDAIDCGIADYEPLNPVYQQPGILRGFVGWRLANNMRARVYVNRANAARALAELGQLAGDPRCLFWIATLDDKPWTQAQLAIDLARNWKAPIPVAQIWACQNEPRGDYDISVLYGTW